MKRRMLALLLAVSVLLALGACGGASDDGKEDASSATGELPAEGAPGGTGKEPDGTTLIYGSGDYTRINPALDEHGEINLLIFDGLTAHNGDNEVVPGLAKRWDYDADTSSSR